VVKSEETPPRIINGAELHSGRSWKRPTQPSTRMSSTHDTDQPHIVFEKCSACSGVFFDAGEFTDFQEYTLAERLKYWAG
jgi:hypothetical protein